ncbi:hypothetical protein [Listeria rustica]|uniref:Uncharacterized protein n=1 Tax=Listeria rustica TaxID=2713503 RepID=A0A7W1YGA7_9LIST|nr:hypothetical protein [Listeria rustica]MBA3926491.1 hypothetical protein [Listeria rustica]
MSTAMRFLGEHAEEATDYWMSAYYMNSEEYQARKFTPGYIEAQRKETVALLRHALMDEVSIPSNAKNMGEDRYDMQTDFRDVLKNHMSFYQAMNEFLIIHYMKRTFTCEEKDFFEELLKLRKYEAVSIDEFVAGYMLNQAVR